MAFPALLHSISYSGSWGQARLTLDEFIDKTADLGFDGVLLAAKRPHVSVLDYGPAERARLRERIETRGLRAAIAGYNNFTADLEHGDVPNYEIQVHYVCELARLAHDLGAGLVRIFTGYEHPAGSYTAQWNLVVNALRECSRRAAEWGVTIGVQNHHDLAVGYESQYDLICAVNEPNCKALFDAWAPALHGVDIVEAARRMAPVTAHTTIANYQPRPRYHYQPAVVNYAPQTPYMQAVPMDEGFIDYRAFLGALAEGGFHGTVAYEMCSPLKGGGGMENLDCCARKFLEFIRG
ncbi:MAG: sugar phosphate isomerase/epimerase family protein [Bryobacteraceae bacterium]